MPGKLPWFKFFPDRWMSDERLRACSSEARGLWIDMLCLMHKNGRRGYLELSGCSPTLEQLARMTGRSTEETTRQFQELQTSGVFSATAHGIVFSRAMVSDEEMREKCSAAGKRGGGNPRLRQGIKVIEKDSSNVVLNKPLSSNLCSLSPNSEGGVGETNGDFSDVPFPGQSWACFLAREWVDHFRGMQSSQRDLLTLDGFFDDLIASGVRPDEIRDAIRDPKRPKREETWELEKRWKSKALTAKGGGEELGDMVRRLEAERVAQEKSRQKNEADGCT